MTADTPDLGPQKPPPEPDEQNPAAFTDDDPVETDPTGGGMKVLGRLLNSTPFLNLHERAGSPTEHPIRGHICFWLDFVVRFIAWVLLVAAAGGVVYKALAPFPEFWHR